MYRWKAIFLLLIFSFSITPWQLVCTAHPFGHEHHENNQPSICDLHKSIQGQEGEFLLPPMECEHINSALDDFTLVVGQNIVPDVQLLAIVAVIFEIPLDFKQNTTFLIPPIPKCRSATLLSDSPLRAPPFI